MSACLAKKKKKKNRRLLLGSVRGNSHGFKR